MSIKVRLLLSYIAMIIVPVILFALVAGMLVSLFLNGMPGGADGKPVFWQTFNQRDELFAGLKFMARTDPDKFGDGGFLANVDGELQRMEAGLVVVKGDRIAFATPGVAAADPAKLMDELARARTESSHPGWGAEINGRYNANHYDFTFGDGSRGTLYLLSDLNPFFARISRFFPALLLSLLLIIALTNGILTYLVSRSIIKPLYALKHAAEQIREGNLDHEVNLKRKDEIGELGAAFEEMRRRLNESIRIQLRYEENRKELISNISHDLKTPITGIQACIQGIRDGIADTEPKRDKYLGMIAGKTEEMVRLIDELFLFSKLDLNRLPFHMEPMDLASYLHDCVEECRHDPRIGGADIVFNRSGVRPVPVLADREKLHRVIMNVIDNSLKYGNKEQPNIRVELRDGPDTAAVTITDNGPGIPSDALPHIFDRFYRAEPSRNPETGGSGLGLAIVKQIVEGHGGTVWAESRAGEGASITFTLRKLQGGDS